MDALILSCSTGGGHNAAAEAMAEELKRRGHHVDLLDPYTLTGKNRDRLVGNSYVKCVQNMPRLFGFIYKLGNAYRHLPVKSPVFWANKKAADCMEEYLKQHIYDVILITHIFPGEILTHLRRREISLPPLIYIATDYTCIPFTEEIECDYFIIPSGAQKEEFCSWGIAPEKVIPIGIPVKSTFREKENREEALSRLGLDFRNRYILLAGGSIGAGQIAGVIDILQEYLNAHGEVRLIVVCGTNGSLYEEMKKRYGAAPQILLLERTDAMAEYLKACDIYISKPGGVSSTEAAVAGVPLIHIPPIPGCETRNRKFFSDCGMSVAVSNLKKDLLPAIRLLSDKETVKHMEKAQKREIDERAAERIADFAEKAADHAGQMAGFAERAVSVKASAS